MYSCSKRAIPAQMAASISPCVFMATSNVSPVPRMIGGRLVPPRQIYGCAAVEIGHRGAGRSRAQDWFRACSLLGIVGGGGPSDRLKPYGVEEFRKKNPGVSRANGPSPP